MLALTHRNFETVDYLLSSNADPCIAAPYGSCLHLAAQYGKVALADQLIRAGVDVNGYNQNDETPLFFAVGHYCGTATRETIDLLLACGARCDVTMVRINPFSSIWRLNCTDISRYLFNAAEISII